MLGKAIRSDIYAVYGFVRLADEIVDTYPNKNPSQNLKLLRAETSRAIHEQISFNPVLHAFQHTVNRYNIDYEFIDSFFESMAMDLEPQRYDRELYEKYIYGSAEVVGLMCLKIFCREDQALFQQLIEPARKLGSAFQKVNFLRDLKSDLEDRKRIYFPGLDIGHFSHQDKVRIEQEIEEEFASALVGIRQLPICSRKGVFLAYQYYRGLLAKIRKSNPEQLLAERVRISNLHKLRLFIGNMLTGNSFTFENG